MTEVFMNGKYVGDVENPQEFVNQIRSERRLGSLTSNVNVQYKEVLDEVHVECRRGRVRRPLIVVRDGSPLLTEVHIKQLEKNEITWDDLVKQGILEYIDADEEENVLVAFEPKDLSSDHTHLEITPLAMLGLCTALVPFGNHTQSARLSIGSKNQKQSLGLYTANYSLRMDMDVSILHTPQVPIVKTIMHDISKYEKHPSGQNVVVAVMSYKGYNMEDAIIINEGSINRGFARSTYFRPAIAEELRYSGGLMDDISIPDKDVKGYKSEKDYKYLSARNYINNDHSVLEIDKELGGVYSY